MCFIKHFEVRPLDTDLTQGFEMYLTTSNTNRVYEDFNKQIHFWIPFSRCKRIYQCIFESLPNMGPELNYANGAHSKVIHM